MPDDLGFTPLAKPATSGSSDGNDLSFTPITQSSSFQKLKPTSQPRTEIVGNEAGGLEEFPLWKRPLVGIQELLNLTGAPMLRQIRDTLAMSNPMKPLTTYRPAPRFQISLGDPQERVQIPNLQMVQQPDPIQPGRSLIDMGTTQFDPSGRAVYNPFQKMVMGAVTPENLLGLGLAGSMGGLAKAPGVMGEAANVGSRALSGFFGAQGAEGLAPIVNPSSTPEERRDAIEMAPLNALLLHGGAHGMLHESAIPPQPTEGVGSTAHPVEGGQMGSVAQVLARIAQNPDSPYAKQAASILQSPRGQGVELINKGVGVDPNLSQAGEYTQNGQKIGVHPEFTDNDFVVMHEIGHYLTEQRLKNPKLNQKLVDLYNEAKESGVDSNLHGMKNLDEFVTEAMTNPSFQQSLKFVRSGERSLFNKFLDFANESVGRARKKGSLLEQVEQATKPVVEAPSDPLQIEAPKPEPPYVPEPRKFTVGPTGATAEQPLTVAQQYQTAQPKAVAGLLPPPRELPTPKQFDKPSGTTFIAGPTGVAQEPVNPAERYQVEQKKPVAGLLKDAPKQPEPPYHMGPVTSRQAAVNLEQAVKGEPGVRPLPGSKDAPKKLNSGVDAQPGDYDRFQELQGQVMDLIGKAKADPTKMVEYLGQSDKLRAEMEQIKNRQPKKGYPPEKPGLKSGVEFLEQESGKLSSGVEVKQKVKDAWKEFTTNISNNERSSQLLDAADTRSKMQGEQIGNRLAVGLKRNVIDDNAVTFIQQSGFDRNKLSEFLNQVKGKSPEAEQSIRRAISDFSRLEPYAKELRAQQEAQIGAEHAKGIETPHLQDYVKHSYEDEDTGLFAMGPSGGFVSTSFLKPKTYPDYATAIADGAKPKTLRASKLLQSRITAGQKLINRVEWANQLRELKAPNGDPLVADLIKRKDTVGYTAPDGYQVRDLSPGVRVAVSDSAADIVDQLIKPSTIRDSAIGRAALKGEAWLKHKMLAFDTFHLFRVQRRAATLGAFGYKEGLNTLMYDDATLGRMVKDKQISPEMAKWAKDNRGTVDLLTKNGLNAGRIADALFSEVVRRKGDNLGLNPLKHLDYQTGKFNRWVFEDVSRGAMTIAAVKEFKRTKLENPGWSDQQTASYVSKQVNIAFGNLQRQGVLKSETFRDLASLAFFAPQWIESLAQGEGRAYKQVGDMAVNALQGKKKIGTSLKMVATSVLGWMVANQVVNMVTQRKPTWENEKGHKLDAKLPGGFWNSPFADTSEYLHDFSKYTRKGETGLQAMGKIVQNKLSPAARALSTAVVGRDYSGAKLGDSDRIKESLKALIPTPLPVSGFTSEIPKQTGRQIYSTLGLKVEPEMRQHEEALEKIAGKRFEDMTFPERIQAEAKRAESQPLQNADQAMKAAQKSVELVNQRGKQLQNGMSREDRNWLDARGLSLGGYDSQVNFTKQDLGSDKSVKVRLTDTEMEQYHDVLQKYYTAGMRLLKDDYDKLDTVGQKKEYYTELMKYVRDGARQEMKKKMLDSNIEMNQKRKSK